ncbi:MAG TPA: DUF190 domain-containing protein [Candidatus Angelobacter sp.]|nr:DUF190 domain-containing protein [Candidatus Angelobacter sp.]
MTLPQDAVQISIYLSEADEWHRKPLHLELLKYLREQRIAGGHSAACGSRLYRTRSRKNGNAG